MGAINFDFDAVIDQNPGVNVRQDKFSRLATLAGPEEPNRPSPGQDVSRLASLAGAPPRFSGAADTQKRPCPSAKVANLLTFGAGDLGIKQSDHLRGWRDAFSVIVRDRPPKGYHDDLWRHLHRDGAAFLDTWGQQAVALGWSTLDLFGVHCIAPVANYAAIGLVPLLRGSEVVAMTMDSATTQSGPEGARLTFRRQPEHPEAVPVWKLPR